MADANAPPTTSTTGSARHVETDEQLNHEDSTFDSRSLASWFALMDLNHDRQLDGNEMLFSVSKEFTLEDAVDHVDDFMEGMLE